MSQKKLIPQNFEIVSGNDKTINVTVLNENAVAVGITGATIVWAVAIDAKSKSRIFFYTSPANITIILPQTGLNKGKFRIDVQDTDTEPLSIGRIRTDYHHEARMVSASGVKTTVMTGTMTVLGNVIPA